MKVKLQPIKNNILIKPYEEYGEEVTKSGLYIPQNTSKEAPQMGKVIEIGSEVEHVKIGDGVIFKRYAGDEMEVDTIEKNKDKLLVLCEDDVLATYEEINE